MLLRLCSLIGIRPLLLRAARGGYWLLRGLRLALPWTAVGCGWWVAAHWPRPPASGPKPAVAEHGRSAAANGSLTEMLVSGLSAALVFYCLVLFVSAAWRARKRLIIEEFADYTGEAARPAEPAKADAAKNEAARPDASKPTARGIATLLAVQLMRISELYRNVDEQRVTSTEAGTDKPVEATINLENVGEALKSAVSAESKFSLGPVGIPIGSLLALLGRMVQGPRIVGSLHKDAQGLILTARLLGGERPHSWRVDSPALAASSAAPPVISVDAMIEEMACRIFTDLSCKGAMRWKAMSPFIQALTAYRDCLRTPKDRKLNLKKSERQFRQAIAEDNQFDLAYYNLGVVYTELGQWEAAASVFLQAARVAPERWQSFYALANNYHTRARALPSEEAPAALKLCEDVIQMCDRVLVIKPATARAYQLKGFAERLISKLSTDAKIQKSYLDSAARSRARAVAHAWKELCVEELRKQQPMEERGSLLNQRRLTAASCLHDLAVSYAYIADKTSFPWHIRKALALFKQSLWLNPSAADTHLELAKTSLEFGRYTLAIKHFQIKLQITPDDALGWAYLAMAYENVHRPLERAKARQQASQCWEKFFAHAFAIPEDQLTLLAQDLPRLLNRVGATEKNNALQRINGNLEIKQKTAKCVEELDDAGKRKEHIVYFEKKQEECAANNWEWEHAQSLYVLGMIYYNAVDIPDYTDRSRGYCQDALTRLTGKPVQFFFNYSPILYLAWGLSLKQASSQAGAEDFSQAFDQAQKAIMTAPMDVYARAALAVIFMALSDWEQARDTWEAALLLSPDWQDIHLQLGNCYNNLGQRYRDDARRKPAFQQAITYYRQALELSAVGDLNTKVGLHQLIGQVYRDLGEYVEAIAYFATARSMQNSPTTLLFLSDSYNNNQDYDKCAFYGQEIIDKLDAGRERTETGQLGFDFAEVTDRDAGKSKMEESAPVDALLQQLSREEAYALGHTLLASSYLLRDIRLYSALEHIITAEAYIQDIPKLPNTPVTNVKALCACYKGGILCGLDRVDEAIDALETSLIVQVDAGAYFYLALAHERKWQRCTDPFAQAVLLTRLLGYCDMVTTFDVKHEYGERVQKLLQRVQQPLPKPPELPAPSLELPGLAVVKA